MDEQSAPWHGWEIVEHVVRGGNVPWDGPGVIRLYWLDSMGGLKEALDVAASMEPSTENAVRCRVYDNASRTWLDTNEPAWPYIDH